jgi:hypothetical protein
MSNKEKAQEGVKQRGVMKLGINARSIEKDIG